MSDAIQSAAADATVAELQASTAKAEHKVLLINGPNLNLLGTREPSIYGSTTLPELTSTLVEHGSKLNITVVPFQSNHEGAIVDFLHSHFTPATTIPSTDNTSSSPPPPPPQQTPAPASNSASTKQRTVAIINPAAYTHTSVAIRDALLATSIPFVEVHISNVHAREAFRHKSFLSDKATGVIMGLGTYGYTAALEFWAGRWRDEDAAFAAASTSK